MDMTEKTLASERIYSGKIINLRRDTVSLPGGKQSLREVVEHPGGVCVAAVDGAGYVYMVRQFRYAFGEELLELPAGKLDAGEDPDAAAARELSEETGVEAERLERVGEFYPSVGYLDERLYLYLATGLAQREPHPDDGELLECVKMPLADAVEAVLSDGIRDGKTKALLLLAQKLLEQRGE